MIEEKIQEQTLENLLEKKIYRVSKKDINSLADLFMEKIVEGTLKGVSNICSHHGYLELLDGKFKGHFPEEEGGEKRREYAEKVLKRVLDQI